MGLYIDHKRRTWCRRESTVTVAQQDRQELLLVISKSQVEIAITIEIAKSDIVWSVFCREGRPTCMGESSLAITKQNGHIIALLVGNNDVRLTVAVDIRDRDTYGPASNGEARNGLRHPGNCP